MKASGCLVFALEVVLLVCPGALLLLWQQPWRHQVPMIDVHSSPRHNAPKTNNKTNWSNFSTTIPTDIKGILTAEEFQTLWERDEYQARRLQANCPLSASSGRVTASLAFDREFVQLMKVTLGFQFLMLDENPNDPQVQARYQYFKVWQDIDDQTLVAKSPDKHECHGAIRATITPTDIIDNWQNVNPDSKVMRGTDCKVRKGFYDAVFTGYVDDWRQAVVECVALCVPTTGQNCPLVLSAAIDLKEYNPMIISFGCMRAIVDDPKYPCTDLDRTRHFRFVNTNPVAEIEYDGIVMQRWPIDNVQVGHSILFDDQNYPPAYLGLDDDVSRKPYNFDIHFRTPYQERIDQMLALPDACYPIPLGKWPVNHVCGYNDECETKLCIRVCAEPQSWAKDKSVKETAIAGPVNVNALVCSVGLGHRNVSR